MCASVATRESSEVASDPKDNIMSNDRLNNENMKI